MITYETKPIRLSDLRTALKANDIGHEMYRMISDLYPICRSITGNGFRETLNVIKNYISLEVHEVPSGTEVFDWTVPKEWNIKDAYIKNLKGETVIDFKNSNLHVVSYSTPIKKVMRLEELKAHLFTLPDYPDRIPYRTSYYKESWGFCLSHQQFLSLKDEEYEVCIDSSLEAGSLTYGEYFLQGESKNEVLISCHACHPSLCNDNLSGIALATFIAKSLSQASLSYSYRFLFIPGTIGSITWLALNEAKVNRIKHGLVLTGVGDPGSSTYKKSRQGDAEIDRAAIHVLKYSNQEHKVIDFFPFGYDERQFCSPGFNLPVGCFMRSAHGHYSEYHTSADDLHFVQSQYLEDSFSKCISILDLLENNKTYLSTNTKCEPRLGKRGLYRLIGGQAEEQVNELALLWVMNLSDGKHTLLDIANKADFSFETIKKAADALLEHGLLKSVGKYAQLNNRAASQTKYYLKLKSKLIMPALIDKIAVVTGASSGIGRAIALNLAAQGTRLCLVGRKLATLEAVAEIARKTAPQVLSYSADLTVDEDIRKLATDIHQDFGHIDVLIHSAGVISLGELKSASVQELDWQYQINVRAPYLLTQILLPMLISCQSQIVFINSSAGLSAKAGVGQYAATKYALKAIADSLREEVNTDGLRVLSVFPGRTATPMQASVHEMEGKAYEPERLMQPQDVATVVINALCLPHSTEVTDIKIRPFKKP